MTPATKKHQQLILLEPEKAALLDKLASQTRIPKQVLLREAVDDLLVKWEVVPSPATSNVARFKTRAMRAADAVFDPIAQQLGFRDSGDGVRKLRLRKETLRAERARRKPSKPKP
jgi:hypothetical protein